MGEESISRTLKPTSTSKCSSRGGRIMDITKITDVKELESLAYKQIKLLNQTQANLQALEQRIAQLEQEAKEPSK